MFSKDNNVSEHLVRNHRSRDVWYHMCHVSKTPPFSKKNNILQSLEGPQKHEVEYCGCGEVDREKNQTYNSF